MSNIHDLAGAQSDPIPVGLHPIDKYYAVAACVTLETVPANSPEKVN
jgi:hypothetical protein